MPLSHQAHASLPPPQAKPRGVQKPQQNRGQKSKKPKKLTVQIPLPVLILNLIRPLALNDVLEQNLGYLFCVCDLLRCFWTGAGEGAVGAEAGGDFLSGGGEGWDISFCGVSMRLRGG